MAFAHETHHAQQGLTLGSWLRELRIELAQRLARHRLYRETLSELASLTDRELEDLGLHRSTLAEVARTAADQA